MAELLATSEPPDVPPEVAFQVCAEVGATVAAWAVIRASRCPAAPSACKVPNVMPLERMLGLMYAICRFRSEVSGVG